MKLYQIVIFCIHNIITKQTLQNLTSLTSYYSGAKNEKHSSLYKEGGNPSPSHSRMVSDVCIPYCDILFLSDHFQRSICSSSASKLTVISCMVHDRVRFAYLLL